MSAGGHARGTDLAARGSATCWAWARPSRVERSLRVSALVSQNRPAFVIAPAGVNVEVAGRVPFAPEAKSLDQATRSVVAGLDVRFQTVKAQPAKCMVNNEGQALGHEALVFVRPEAVVAEVGALKGSVDDLTDVHDADELTRPAQADEMADMGASPESAQIRAVGGCSRGGRDPRSMERSAPAHRREELGQPSRRWPL